MSESASFGDWIRRRRRALDLTREALAQQVGCAVVTIRKIEADERRPSRQIAERLAECLQIPTEERAVFLQAARAELAIDRLPIPPVPSLAPPPVVSRAPAHPPADRQPRGQSLKGYELHEQIGSGGFGTVYCAAQVGIGREVAVKIIRPEYANHPDFIRRFEAEAQLVARLEHPHIVPLYDYWRERDGAYLVMRYVRNGSLQTALEQGSWPLDRSTRLLEQIAGALAFAHRHGVVHRDLKPANILLDEDGDAYLADFGIAKDLWAANAEGQTQPDTIVGSPDYLSPEQIKDESVTPQTDIYCLGMLLYETLVGVHPFADLVMADRLYKQLHEPFPPLQSRRPDLPAALNEVIQHATTKQPAARFPNVASMVMAWRQALPPEGMEIASSETPLESTPPAGDLMLPSSALVAAVDTLTMTEFAVVENPYKGLRAFAEADAADFFGRETLTRQLLERLAEEDADARFLAVVGPSGSGKSSVVRAGLIPALRRGALPGSERWFVLELLPGAHPLEELEAALLRVAVNPPPSLLEQLQSDERGLARAVKRVLPADRETELVLVIDQFEELFTLTEEEAVRAHVLASLRAALLDPHSRLRVVVTLRADFYGRPLLYAGFGELMQQRTQVILPLTTEELEQAIAGPAARVGVTPAPELVAAIIKDVGEQPGTLPLLQYALTELFEQRTGHTLTLAAYRVSGGVRGALARRADEIYLSLDSHWQEAVRQLFLRLITPGEASEDTRRRVLQTEIASLTTGQPPMTDTTIPHHSLAIDVMIERYGRARLLSFDRDPITREPTVEVAHEALLREWGRLRVWLDASRDDLRVQRRLAAAAIEWVQAGRDASFLVSGARLAQFEGWATHTTVALTPDERAFLMASVAERERQEEIARERQVNELAQARALAEEQQRRAEAESQRAEEQTRASKRLRRRAIWLAATAVLALGAALFAALQQQRATIQAANAEHQARLALARQIIVQVLNLASNQVDLRLLLSAEAARRADISETRATLMDTLERTSILSTYLGHHTDRVRSVAFSPDGKLLASGSSDSTIILWDLAAHQPLGSALTGHEGPVTSVAFSPDGKLLASGGSDRTIILWDVATHQPLGPPFIGHTDWVRSVAFSPDGRTLASGGDDKAIILWNVTTHEPLGMPLTGHEGTVTSVAFSPDGKLLASGGSDRTIILWDVATHQPLGPPFIGHTDWVRSVAFSPDGRTLASGSDDKAIMLWNVTTHEPLGTPLNGHTDRVTSIAFSPDGKLLASGSNDKTIMLWDVVTHQPHGPPLTGHTKGVEAVAFRGDGKLLVSGSLDKTVALWDLATRQPLASPLIHADMVSRVAFSPDGKLLASGGHDNTIVLWDLATRQPLGAPLIGHTNWVTGVAFSPDGKLLASSSLDKTIILWDLATHKPLGAPLIGYTDQARAVAFSPDGKLLASAGDRMVLLWDVAAHQLLSPHLTGHTDTLTSVAFSPDGKTLASGSNDNTIILWDVVTHWPRGPLLRSEAKINSLAFSPDGKILASGNDDRTITLWDPATHQLLGSPLTGHTKSVWAIAFSPDGKLLASTSPDMAVILWDVATRQQLGPPLTGHTDVVGGIAFSPDGKMLATSSDDKTIMLWDTSIESWQARACEIANRNLTQAEWNQFIGADIPYERTCPALAPG